MSSKIQAQVTHKSFIIFNFKAIITLMLNALYNYYTFKCYYFSFIHFEILLQSE